MTTIGSGTKKPKRHWKNHVKVLLTILSVGITVAVFVLALLVIVDPPRQPQVEGGFTRVGGPTRVDTAADAARFWLKAPRRVVMTPIDASADVMLYAARCAMDENAPLLFTSNTGSTAGADNELIDHWDPIEQTTIYASGSDCPGTAPKRLHTLTENKDVLPGNLGPKAKTTLGGFVVFAASKDPAVSARGGAGSDTEQRDLPDVAVGLALAAHMARAHPKLGRISLVVVPEYLEADPALENNLRAQEGEVLGGIILGGPSRISDDTRTLLRQILRPADAVSVVGALQGILGPAGGLIGAILALLVGAAASVAAVAAARDAITGKGPAERMEGGPMPEEPAPLKTADSVGGGDGGGIGPSGGAKESSATTQASAAAQPDARHTPFDVRDPGQPRVTLYLTDDRIVNGIYKGEETIGGVTFMKLADAETAGLERAHRKMARETGTTLIPIATIKLATTEASPPEDHAQTASE
jgi:hypothetical protein